MSQATFFSVLLAALSAGFLGWFAAYQILIQVKYSAAHLPRLNQDAFDRRKILVAAFILLLLISTLFFGFSLVLIIAPMMTGIWILIKRIPSWKNNYDLRKKLERMREIFPPTLGMAIQSLKTGQTLSQVIEYLSRESPSPLKEEWGLVCAEMNLGASVERALTKMNDRFPNFNELSRFLESYKISRQTGANMIQLLDVLVEGMEEKNRILRKMEALTAQARLSGLLMGLLPMLLGLVFFIMDPNLILPLFTEKTGWVLLLLAAFLETIGFLWIRQLLRLED